MTFVLVLVLALRLAWQVKPHLLTCAVFWSGVAISRYLAFEFTFLEVSSLAGVTANAAVTLVNGGYMPVVSSHPDHHGFIFSVWKSADQLRHPRLLVLSDRLGPYWCKVSPGDILILAPILLYANFMLVRDLIVAIN